MLSLPTDHPLPFTSSPSIYLVSTDEGRSDGTSQPKGMPPPQRRDAGPPFCFFLPGCELNQLPRLHPSCCRAGGGSEYPRAGRKTREGKWKLLLSQATGVLKRLQARNLSRELPRSAVTWKGLGKCRRALSLFPMCCFKAVGCQDRWV